MHILTFYIPAWKLPVLINSTIIKNQLKINKKSDPS